MSEESKQTADGLEVYALCPYNEHGCFSPHMAPINSLPEPEKRAGYLLAADAQRLLSQLREELAQRDAEIERLKSAAPVVSDVIHHAFSRDRDIGWNAPAADQALRELFEDWLKRSQFTRPNSPWDIWKACAEALESQQAASVGCVPDVNDLANFIRHTDGNHKMGTGALAERIVDWLSAKSAASVGGERDREADRAVFTDPLFNKWLDEPITENGEYSVWHQVGDTGAAWHGWENRQFYVDQEYAELRARAALSPAGGGVVMPGRKRVDPYRYNPSVDGWNACLDEFTRLNAKPQANSQEADK